MFLETVKLKNDNVDEKVNKYLCSRKLRKSENVFFSQKKKKKCVLRVYVFEIN